VPASPAPDLFKRYEPKYVMRVRKIGLDVDEKVV